MVRAGGTQQMNKAHEDPHRRPPKAAIVDGLRSNSSPLAAKMSLYASLETGRGSDSKKMVHMGCEGELWSRRAMEQLAEISLPNRRTPGQGRQTGTAEQGHRGAHKAARVTRGEKVNFYS